MTDKQLAAMIRELERVSQQVQAWAQVPPLPPGIASALRDVEKFAARENPHYQHVMKQAAAWMKQLEWASRPSASPVTVERRVVAQQAKAPALLEGLEVEGSRLRALEAENARLRAERAADEAAKQALRPKRRPGQKITTEKQRQAAIAYTKNVDARRDGSRKKTGDEMRLRDAVKAEIRKQEVRKQREGKFVRVPGTTFPAGAIACNRQRHETVLARKALSG